MRQQSPSAGPGLCRLTGRAPPARASARAPRRAWSSPARAPPALLHLLHQQLEEAPPPPAPLARPHLPAAGPWQSRPPRAANACLGRAAEGAPAARTAPPGGVSPACAPSARRTASPAGMLQAAVPDPPRRAAAAGAGRAAAGEVMNDWKSGSKISRLTARS